jgi:hypothetical protein
MFDSSDWAHRAAESSSFTVCITAVAVVLIVVLVGMAINDLIAIDIPGLPLPKARATSGVQPPGPGAHLRPCGRKTPHRHHCPSGERSATRTTVASRIARRRGEASIRLIGPITEMRLALPERED